MNIKDLKENYVENQVSKKIILENGFEFYVVNTKKLHDQVKLIDKIIAYCSENEGFFNPFKLEIIANILIIQEYTTIEIPDEMLEGSKIYETYDILNWNKVFDILVEIKDYSNIVDWAHRTCLEISHFGQSFIGVLTKLQEHQFNEQSMNQLKSAFEDLMQKQKMSIPKQ